MLAKIADKLPIQWDGEGDASSARRRSPPTRTCRSLIYPNPLNPTKYVVLNSGFTFREYDYLNNARQVPKLPDWAVVDITTARRTPAPRQDRARPGSSTSSGSFSRSGIVPAST